MGDRVIILQTVTCINLRRLRSSLQIRCALTREPSDHLWFRVLISGMSGLMSHCFNLHKTINYLCATGAHPKTHFNLINSQTASSSFFHWSVQTECTLDKRIWQLQKFQYSKSKFSLIYDNLSSFKITLLLTLPRPYMWEAGLFSSKLKQFKYFCYLNFKMIWKWLN